MATKSRKLFDENAQDIERLFELHKEKGGTSQGRRRGLEVLNKSAIILITSFWEAYCEDIVAEGLEKIIRYGTPNLLPKEIKLIISRELSTAQNNLAVWNLCGDGWKQILGARCDRMREDRNRKLNTPRTQNIDDLFLNSIGLKSISSSWKWAKKMTSKRAREKLDKYVTLRGEIAHRGKAAKSVTKAQVADYFDFIIQLVEKTDLAVYYHIQRITGKQLWSRRRRISVPRRRLFDAE